MQTSLLPHGGREVVSKRHSSAVNPNTKKKKTMEKTRQGKQYNAYKKEQEQQNTTIIETQ